MNRESGIIAGAVGGMLAGGGGVAVAVFAVRDALAYLAEPADSHLQHVVGTGAVALGSLVGLFAVAVVLASASSLFRRTPRHH